MRHCCIDMQNEFELVSLLDSFIVCVCDVKFCICGCVWGSIALIAWIKRITVYLFGFPCAYLPNLWLLVYVMMCMSVIRRAAFVYLTNVLCMLSYGGVWFDDVWWLIDIHWGNSLCLCVKTQIAEPKLQIIETVCSVLSLPSSSFTFRDGFFKNPLCRCNLRPCPHNKIWYHIFFSAC